MNRFKYMLTCALLVSVLSAGAQTKKYDYGVDSVSCVKNLSLFNEFAKQKAWPEAYGPWKKCIEICPKSRKGQYTKGANMFKGLIKAEKDEAKKKVLIDEYMTLFDLRIENFGQEGFVKGKKGYAHSLLVKDDPCTSMNMMKQAIDIEENKTQAIIVSQYFITLYKCHKADGAPLEDLYTEYLRLSNIISHNIENLTDSVKISKYTKAKNNMDNNFVKVAKCSDIVEIFKKQIEAAPNDIELKKKALKLMSRKECDDDPLFIQLATEVHQAEPSHESAYALARKFAKADDIDQALKYYEEAVSLCGGCAELENYLEKAALVASGSGKHSKALGYANQLLKVNPSNGFGHIVKGNRMMSSGKRCDDGKLGKYVAYWMAYDLFQRAISVDDRDKVKDYARKQMGSAKSRFPTKTEVFQTGNSAGGTYSAPCEGGSHTIRIQ